VSFCLEDVVRWSLDARRRPVYECDFQGIQAGWADVYDRGLPGQWIDVTDVPSGSYVLEVEVNPEHVLPEADYTNNVARVAVDL
jgi:hypothetical protein